MTFTSDFLKEFYSYHRPFQEVVGYFIRQEEDGSNTIFINALGVNPEDVKIEVTSEYPRKQILSVSGSTLNEDCGEEFSVDVHLSVRKPIQKIVKSFNAGLLTLKLEYEEPVKPNVLIVDAKDSPQLEASKQ